MRSVALWAMFYLVAFTALIAWARSPADPLAALTETSTWLISTSLAVVSTVVYLWTRRSPRAADGAA